MHRKTTFLTAALLAASIPLAAQVLETVRVRGTRISGPTTDGSRVLCTGEGCAYMLMMMQMEVNLQWLTQHNELPADDPAVDKDQFCDNLRGDRPPTCAANLPPPSTPTYDTNWQPNGCGDGSFQSDVADYIIGALPGGTDLNVPSWGVNFRSACDAHDYCYGMGYGQVSCDNQFAVDLNNVCASSSNQGCGYYADTYAYAVRSRGATAYARSQAETACAAWKADMEINQCDN